MSTAVVEVSCPVCGEAGARPVGEEGALAVARCVRCGLVYTRRRLRDPQAHYRVSEREALAKYEPILDGVVPHPRDPNYDEQLGLIESVAPPPGDLLDVGSHCGFFLRRARERGWRVQGVEPSSGFAAIARERVGLPVQTGGLEEADIPAESVDVVTLVDVLEHVAEPMPLLRAAYRALRPGGRIFIKVPNARYVVLKHRVLSRVPGLLAEDALDAREHLVFYSDRTLAATLERAGFDVEALHAPSPIEAGGGARRALRRLGPAVASRVPGGVATPLATDLAALGRKPARPPAPGAQ